MRSGIGRQLVKIQRAVLGEPSLSGACISTWTTVFEVYGNLGILGGRELDFARSYSQTVSHRFGSRWVDGIEITDRLVWNGQLFHINAVLNGDPWDKSLDYRNRALTIYCTQFFDPQDQFVAA